MKHVGRGILNTLRKVFSNPFYVFFSLLAFIAILSFSIWLPNISFIRHIAFSSDLTTSQKVGILAASLGAIRTNFTPLSRVLTILVSLLFSINLSLTIYYFRKRLALEKTIGTNLAGIMAGFLGIGCASCGSVVLTSILGVSATVSFISILPLKGAEFGIIGIGILLATMSLTIKKINEPLSCGVKSQL